MSLNKIGQVAHDINSGNGWDVFYPHFWPKPEEEDAQKERDVLLLCAHMALIHSEVSEATEAVRVADKKNFAEEMGDTIIRVASICHGLGIDLEEAIALKLEKNKKRGFHHGGKKQV
jgi:NTP pyrophosphatase (non-canonical NTP hydrolase)